MLPGTTTDWDSTLKSPVIHSCQTLTDVEVISEGLCSARPEGVCAFF